MNDISKTSGEVSRDGMTMREALMILQARSAEEEGPDLFNIREHWEQQPSIRERLVEKPTLDLEDDEELVDLVRLNIMQKNLGVTLVETLIGIVILSISFTAVASLLTQSVATSASPVIREQAIAIAESHLEMVALHPFSDPNQADTNTCEEGNDSNRALYDDVNDFRCLNDSDGARDAAGNLIPGLGAYNVDIDIPSVILNGAPALEITVNVTHDADSGVDITLIGYRVNYP